MISLLPVARSWLKPYYTAELQQHDMKPLLQSLLVMAWMVEARAPYTGGHLWRVSQYCRLLAEQLGLSKYEVARITIGGFLHNPIQNCLTCGPTIVVKRSQKSGESTYCPNCAAEAIIEKDRKSVSIHPTGRKGSVKSLQPKPDLDLIGEFVATSAAALSVFNES